MKFLLLISVFVFCSVSYAEDWAFNFSLNQDLSYDDNVTMDQEPQESTIYELDSNLTFLYKTETIELQADTSYGIQRYIDISEFDSNTQNHSIQGTYFTEKSNFGLSIDYSIIPSRDTAVEDSGNFGSSSDKETKSIAPFISYSLTESDNIFIQTLYTENTSSEEDFGDNNNKKIDLAWQHQWTQRYNTTFVLFFSQFEFIEGRSNADTNTASITENETISNNYGVNFSSTFLFSDRWTITSGIGVRITETTEELINNEKIKTNSKGFLTDTSINYAGESFIANLAIARALIPSNRGQLDEQTKLSLGLGYKMTQYVSTSFSANYQISKKESDDSDNDETERENINFESSINWEISQQLTLSGSYSYSFQETSDEDFSVDSNLFMLSIGYEWPGQQELK